MRSNLLFISAACFFLPLANYAACQAACSTKGACDRTLTIGTKKITYYSNFPLNQLNNCIEQVIYVVHGSEREAESRYFSVLNAAKSLNKQNNVLIIAPFFKTNDDNPGSNDYYWTDSGWKQGNTSTNNGTQISSFSVADTILNTVTTNAMFPLLKNVTVTGHSAGGQYTQLYALTTPNPDQHPTFSYQFLVLNPSNYSYLNNLRPHPTTSNLFEQPVYWDGKSWKMKPAYQAAGNCPNSYNEYKYGLDDRNNYASQFPINTLINQFLGRKVYYFLGDQDTDPNDPSLDTTCSAKLQGPYRLKRGQNFYAFLNQYYPTHQHAVGIVPGVGHEGSEMYGSNVVKAVLFK